MKVNRAVSDAVTASYGKEQYDAQVKKLLSDKQILAWILKHTTMEFKDDPIADIMEAIEGMPEIGTVPVNPGLSNAESIMGMSNEDSVPNEGKVMFDIRFYAVTRTQEKVKLLINVEAQKDYYPGYDLVTRGIFYGARMLSAQLGAEFQTDNYDDIKKVYSIWICMNAPDYAADTITEYRMAQYDLVGSYSRKARYDLLSVVMVRLGKALPDEKTPGLQKLLYTLLSNKIKPKEKAEKLSEEFGIKTMREGANLMCNLSDLIEEEGIAKGREQGIRILIEVCQESGFSKTIVVEKIKSKYELSPEAVENYIEKYWKS